MEELRALLEGVEDTYDDFVSGIISYVKIPGNEKKAKWIADYIINHPKADTVEIIRFVLRETGFFESNQNRELHIVA